MGRRRHPAEGVRYAEAFDRWKDEYDPEGVAFEYPVIGDAGEMIRQPAP